MWYSSVMPQCSNQRSSERAQLLSAMTHPYIFSSYIYARNLVDKAISMKKINNSRLVLLQQHIDRSSENELFERGLELL